MVDRYTKAVLTVIAAALVVIVIRQAAPSANANWAGCGQNIVNPCYISNVR